MSVRDPLSPEPADGGGYVGHARDYRLASDDPAVGEKVGRTFAHQIRQRSRGELGNKWHLDEVVISNRGEKHWLWRAVDQDGFVLEVLVQGRRNAQAAKRLMCKLLKGQGRAPGVMITDKLRSYDVARQIMPGVEHRSQRPEQSGGKFPSADPKTRADHEALQITRPGTALRLHPRSDPNLFHIPRHDISSSHHRELRAAAMDMWTKIARI